MNMEDQVRTDNILEDVEILFDDIIASEPSVDSCSCCCVSCCCTAATSNTDSSSESSI